MKIQIIMKGKIIQVFCLQFHDKILWMLLLESISIKKSISILSQNWERMLLNVDDLKLTIEKKLKCW